MELNKVSAIHYLRSIYGGEVYCRNGEYYILFKEDKFKIKPSDLNKTYHFCLYENGEYECKFVDSNLIRGMFVVCNYPIYKETGAIPTGEDWLKFVADMKRYGG